MIINPATRISLGLAATDSPSFAGLTISGNLLYMPGANLLAKLHKDFDGGVAKSTYTTLMLGPYPVADVVPTDRFIGNLLIGGASTFSVGATLGGSVGIGRSALCETDGYVSAALAFGVGAMNYAKESTSCVAIGASAGVYESGLENTWIGTSAGPQFFYPDSSSAWNIGLGSFALSNTPEGALLISLVAIGGFNFQNISSGLSSTAIGDYILAGITGDVTYSTFIGANIGSSLSGDIDFLDCIIIGANAGPATATDYDSQMWIDKLETDYPTIWADFANHYVRLVRNSGGTDHHHKFSRTGYITDVKITCPEAVIGNATNNATFATDGELALAGTARVKKDIWINSEGFKAPGTKPATAVDYGIASAWEFSDGTDDTLFARVKLPNDMDKSVGMTIYIWWSTPTGSAGNCRWQVEYLFRQANEAMDAVAEATLVANFAASATAKGLVLSTIGTTAVPNAADVCLTMRIKRRADEAADTLGEDNHLHGLCVEYTSNKLGTAT